MADESSSVPAPSRIEGGPLAALEVLPKLGRVMISASRAGVTHERMGVITGLNREDFETFSLIRIEGETHSSVVHTPRLGVVSVDRSNRMRDKVYPRLTFHDQAGAALFSVIGLDGLEPFDAGLEGVAETGWEKPAAAEASKPADEAAPPPAPEFDALAAARDAEAEISIAYQDGPFSQFWKGRIRELKPAMGFINIIEPDFHLHLKEAVVARWVEAEVPDAMRARIGDRRFLQAFGADGAKLPLTVSGPASAFPQMN